MTFPHKLRDALAFAISGYIWAFWWVLPTKAQAQAQPEAPIATAQPATETVTGETAVLLALEVMLQAGDFEGALALLRATPALANRPDGLRLQAQILIALGRNDEALSVLEGVLAKNARDGLARFQIGEAHFQAKRPRAAETAYRLALASDLDSARSGLARQRLASLAARTGWQGTLTALIAPDSNLNSATTDRNIEIFGLPFELSEDARATGGVTAALQGTLGRAFPLSRELYFSGQLTGLVSDAPGRAFDEGFSQIRLGPEFRLPQEGRLAAQFTHSRRWFGGSLFEVSNGTRLEASLPLGPKTRFEMTARAEYSDNQINPFRSGDVFVLDLGRTYFKSASRLNRYGLTLIRKDAESETEAFDNATLSVGYLFPAPWTSSVYVEGYVSGRWFDAASFAFGVRREDSEMGLSARFTKRDLSFKGWSPFMTVSVSEARSTLVIAEYSRQRVEFGLTQTY